MKISKENKVKRINSCIIIIIICKENAFSYNFKNFTNKIYERR